MTLNPTVSKSFSAEDADLSFLSSDGVIFRIHSKNLEYTCGGFAPPHFVQPPEEPISLTEDSTTLEILFDFVYPKAHPDLENTNFNVLLKLAEAAQKYQVFSALNICQIRLKEKVFLAPISVMSFGFKHDFRDLIAKAAPYLYDIPLKTVIKQLPPALVIPWMSQHLLFVSNESQLSRVNPHGRCHQVEYFEERKAKVMETFIESPSSFVSAIPMADTSDSMETTTPPAFTFSAPSPFPSPFTPLANVEAHTGPSSTRKSRHGQAKSNSSTTNQVIAWAMRRFYEANASTTSLERLRPAIRQAFGIGTKTQGPALIEAKLADDLIRRLEEKLGCIPPFETIFRR